MKKCPKCKAEIQDEARFCLYCMTSFEEKQIIDSPKEKNKRWLYIIAAVLGVAIIASSVFIFGPKDISNKNNTSDSSVSDNSSSTADSNENDGTKSENKQGDESGDNKNPDSNDDDGTNDKPNGDTSSDDTPQNDNQGDDTDADDTTDTPPNTQPKYTYITATTENAYPTGKSSYTPENAIVITKVNYKEASGNYVIPETIDGKKVAAIMPSAFSDSEISASVKSVTLPATVRTIWSDAFKNCCNLTNLYIKSAVIGIYEDAFPASSNRNGRLTIHCKRDCRDFDFYYYRNIASRYDANYAEWNG